MPMVPGAVDPVTQREVFMPKEMLSRSSEISRKFVEQRCTSPESAEPVDPMESVRSQVLNPVMGVLSFLRNV